MTWTVLTVLLLAFPAWGADRINRANVDSAVGQNLRVNNFSTQGGVPWVNSVKMARNWRESPNGTGCTVGDQVYSGAVDADGYPTEFGTRDCIWTELLNATYSESAWPTGQWVVAWDGTATLDVSGSGSSYSATGNRATFTVGTGTGPLYLQITALTSISNLRLYPPGGVCATNASSPYEFEPWSFCDTARCPGGDCATTVSCPAYASNCIDLENAGEDEGLTFHPLWLSHLTRYRVMRFLQWTRGSTNTDTTFDFTPETYWTWVFGPSAEVPAEVMARLCNTLNTDCYVNVPQEYTDSAITDLATFLGANVHPWLQIYLEYGNEMWNGSFSGRDYLCGLANAGVSGYDGSGCTASACDQDCSDGLYGKRTYEMCALAEAVLGDRLTCVMAGQAANAGRLTNSLDCTRWTSAPSGDCYTGSDVDAAAIAPYIGGGGDCPGASDAALCALLDTATATNLDPTSGQTDAHFDILEARSLGWPLIAYEGGSHQEGSGFCQSVVTNACIRTSYLGMLDEWKDNFDDVARPIQTFLHFQQSSLHTSTTFGARGSDEGDQNAWPKEDGLIDWMDTAGNECWWAGCAIPYPSGGSFGGGGGSIQ